MKIVTVFGVPIVTDASLPKGSMLVLGPNESAVEVNLQTGEVKKLEPPEQKKQSLIIAEEQINEAEEQSQAGNGCAGDRRRPEAP